MKCLRVLRARLGELRTRGPNVDLSEAILIQVRQVLENRPYRQDFPTLNFICTCAVHSELHDSSVIYRWLRRLTDSLREMLAGQPYTNMGPLWFNGSTILDLDGLRWQLREVLRREKLDTLLVDEQRHWHEFVRGLLDILCEKEIGLPKSVAGKRPTEPAPRYVADMTALAGKPYVLNIQVVSVGPTFKVEFNASGGERMVFTVCSLLPQRTEYSTVGFAATVHPPLMEINPFTGALRFDLPPCMPFGPWLEEFTLELRQRLPAARADKILEWGTKMFPGVGSLQPREVAEMTASDESMTELLTSNM